MAKQRNWAEEDWTEDDWLKETYGSIGEYIASKIGNKGNDEEWLKLLSNKAIRAVEEREKSPENRQSAMSQINRGIHKTFPRSEDELPNYWHDSSGQGGLKKWRHNIFKYLTLGRGIKQSTEQSDKQTAEVATQQKTEPERAVEPQPKQEELTLKNMTIEQLGLAPEVTQTLEKALKQSGMDLTQFVQKAVEVYAKTITGKAEKHDEDLTMVSTKDLKSGDAYKTHPGRAKELTKRAIRAIKLYNTKKVTENTDRWCITPSAIASLTGSKHKTIQSFIGKENEKGELEIEGEYWDEVKTHNTTYNLNGYSNRKPGKKIEDVVKLTELVPDGL